MTAIEILSYVNKRQPGLISYSQKRDRLLQVGVHLVEVDLLRRGTRPLSQQQVPDSPYRVTVTRAHARIELWAVQMQDRLPTIPIPLLLPDADVPLDLSDALQTVYAEADYDLTIDSSHHHLRYQQALAKPCVKQIANGLIGGAVSAAWR